MSTGHRRAWQRAVRARRRMRAQPMEAHVFTFAFFGPDDRRTGRLAAVVVRGKMGQAGAIPAAYDKAGAIAAEPFCIDIRTYPSRALPERTPHLDRICVQHTGFRCFVDLLIAVAGYRPSIRLDVMGRDGAVLAAAYDRVQARLGDTRRAFVTGTLASSGTGMEKREQGERRAA